MKPFYVLLAAVTLSIPAVHAADAPTPACVAHAAASLDALTHGDYAGARKDFDDAVASKLDAAKLEQVWEQLQGSLGAYQSHGAVGQKTISGHAVAGAALSFANMQLGFVAACDAQDKISSYRFVPVEALASTAVQAHVEDGGVRVSPLDVPTPVGPLHGALTLPAGAGPFPAIVLVAGSGAHDMDETIGPNKPFRDIAEGLARAGVATLRYDKRTFDHPGRSADFAIDAEVTDDAVAAARLLAQQKEIDPRRVFVLGHSLGALMAPRIGQRDPQLAGLVLMAAPGRSLLDVSAQQAREQGQRAHETAAQIAADEQAIAAEQKLLAGADPQHPPAGSFDNLPQGYWLSLYDYHQVEVAKALPMPMLLLQGGSDFQVSPTLDFARWQQELAGRPRTAFHLYPGLSHLFMPAGKTGTLADYKAPAHVDAKVIDDIASWVKAQPAG
ncbi:alpha/beta fold hydrolase [Rhodanobacter sp. DHG33]|uniref:alpha/beta fold hydrolase n=1 Tax=Rhodanobacter sp. DHG33 TaxID=2775921 RepID=UPI0017813D51|nr:alpha/beta fold hydrolase [Rhodanobacter sp. DHG33]MBD8899150.1 alpha/beta fold hydrolase [Rhodanobacter sp. DHG33]